MPITVIPRIDEDGVPILFIPDEPANPGKIVCYAHVGQHSEADMAYYYSCTKPDKTGACKALLDEYYQLGPDEDRQELDIRESINRR